MLKHMCAWCRYTRGRFERTHGHVLSRYTGFSRCHTTHTHHTTHTTTQDTTQHINTTTTPHGDGERQRRRQRVTEKEDRDREKTKEDKTRQDRSRRDKTRMQPWSRLEISRDRQCNEPQVVRGFPEDRQGHSRNHVEEGCDGESNKREDGTSHRDNTTTTTHQQAQHELALCGRVTLDVTAPQWVPRQDTHGTLGPLRRKAVGGSTARPRARDTSHRHEM